jgi:hypothetical protein
MGKQEDKSIRSIYCQKKAKAKPPINRTGYKRLSLGDVQTHNGILKIMRKPEKTISKTLFY